ncbi:MAG: MaoC/PaaZ C-terminal domain-containing protein [Ardenticatenaceae bacterium]|nr:MaoC/PaaZ C-terminal domain-containing protein [Ardenticatenaceae bacterium]
MSTPSGYFEDFAEGMVFHTAGRTISEADIVNFAGLSGDYNPIHTNATYAAGTMFGQRVAHGLLGLSIASGLATQLGFMGDKVEAFLDLEWKFRQPVFIGDTIHAEIKIGETKAARRLGGGIVSFEINLLNQDDKQVGRGVWRVLFKSKPEERG